MGSNLSSNSIDLLNVRVEMVLDLRIITNQLWHHGCTIGTPREASSNLRGKWMVSAATADSKRGRT